jgi:ribonuclease D
MNQQQMNGSIISYQEDFLELCDHITQCGIVSFDSEFISDIGYRPQLGLLQFATPERCVAVDPLAIPSLSAWWDIMVDDHTTVIVHGGQAEVRFCIQLSGRIPRKLVDIQIAEGLRGRSYPLSYNTIVERVLGTVITNSQTRTDWLRRPLSPEQIEYALEDVSYVQQVWERQRQWLESNGRLSWATSEFDRMCTEILEEEQTAPWERISGIHKLPRRELAVAQRLAQWREEEAAFRNRPARRVLRDDLLIDLARRRPKTVQQALATRDLNRPEYRKRLDDIVAVIEEAGKIPDEKLPRRMRSRDDASSDDQIISRLLALALGNVCAELEIAQSLVGTNKDLTELVKFVRTSDSSEAPRLLTGWRGEICGELLKKVLEGRVRFRVSPANSSTPLIFEDQPD